MSINAAISTHAYNGLVPLGVLARLVDRYPNISVILGLPGGNPDRRSKSSTTRRLRRRPAR
jgi:hypothetical protein